MIRLADAEMLDEVKAVWKECFPKQDVRYMDFYFKNMFVPENCFVEVLENKVVATLIRSPHALMFNGRVLRTSMIMGVATLPKYRNRGYMHALMNVAMDACSHTELVTLLQTDIPDLYRPYGFEFIYHRTQYRLERQDVKRITNFGCAYEPSPIDLMKVYSAFIKRFNGFYTRDLDYFIKYKKQIKARDGKVVAFYNGKDQIRGYAVMIPEGQELLVEEIVYLDSMALMKLCNAALQEKRIVNLYVSDAEDLSVAFPRAPKKIYPSTMVCLNNAALFSKLFNQKVENVSEAFALSKRPLNLNEFD